MSFMKKILIQSGFCRNYVISEKLSEATIIPKRLKSRVFLKNFSQIFKLVYFSEIFVVSSHIKFLLISCVVNQKTIAKNIVSSGIGLHSGKKVNLKIKEGLQIQV